MAFAIGRAVGPAVVRNRVRRRLRMLLSSASLPPGWYLIGGTPRLGEHAFDALASDLALITSRIDATAARPCATGGSSG